MALPQHTVPLGVAAGVALVTVVVTLVRDRDAFESPGRLLLGWALTVAAQGHLAAGVTLAVVTLLSTVYVEQAVTRGERHVDDPATFLMAGWFVGVIAIGQAHRTHRAYLREVEQRIRAAECEKDVRARQSATGGTAAHRP